MQGAVQRCRSLLITAVLVGTAHAAPIAVQTTEPRAYGHVVGDLVERRASFVLPAGLSVAEASLPRRGRIDAWLELRDVELRAPSAGSAASQLRVVYQIVNAPKQIATVELPALSLKLSGGGKDDVNIGAWPITVSALTPMAVLARAGLDESQPDIAPQSAPLWPTAARLALWAALLAAALFALALRRYPQWAFWRRRAPFRAAWIDLRQLAARKDEQVLRAALTRLHRAFDAAAGEALFAERLSPLYAAQPRLRSVADEVAQFFQWSRSEFFAAQPAQRACSLAELVALARKLAQAEAGA